MVRINFIAERVTSKYQTYHKDVARWSNLERVIRSQHKDSWATIAWQIYHVH